MSALMSPARAEKWLGLRPSKEGKALLRMALRRERELGRRFVVRSGIGAGQRYLLSRTSIRRHLPELLQGKYERTERALRAAQQRLEAHLNEVIDDRIENHPVIQTLQDRSEETIEHVLRLSEHIERMGGPPATPRTPPA